MQKSYRIILPILLLAVLCACTVPGAVSSPSDIPAEEGSSPTASDTSDTPSPSPSAPVAEVDNSARGALFRAFVSDNYKTLMDAFFGISGVGFIDLDLDGGIELIMTDAGASAALGFQFFDIVDGAVVCVSAYAENAGAVFGTEYLSEVSVNANRFEEFRLFENKKDGTRFFLIESGNGSGDFRYSEWIRFGCDKNDVLTLTSLFYISEGFDLDTGEKTGETLRIGQESADRAAYDAACASFFGGIEDSGFEARGVFLWDDLDNSNDLDGLLAMVDKALGLYEIR